MYINHVEYLKSYETFSLIHINTLFYFICLNTYILTSSQKSFYSNFNKRGK
jgi:hypothetical protein